MEYWIGFFDFSCLRTGGEVKTDVGWPDNQMLMLQVSVSIENSRSIEIDTRINFYDESNWQFQ